MISGATRSLLGVLLLAPSLAMAANPELENLMSAMAQVPAASHRFVETRHLALLTKPIELKGSLTYERPHRLAKHVQSPFDELLSVDGEIITVFNRTKGEQRVISLREQPALAALVESVRATLAGDLPQLERHYKVAFSGAPASWTLKLSPREARVRGYVETITLVGASARLTRVEVLETGGDRSVMTILHDGK